MSDMEKEKKVYEDWKKSEFNYGEREFAKLFDYDESGNALAFYGGYHSRDEEIATLKAEIERKDEALKDALITMHHARVFVNSRQRIKRSEGIEQYDECADKVAQALKDSE